MKRIFLALCSMIAALSAVSCTLPSPSPAGRIAERPMAFEKLSDRHKELVQSGEIDKGMGMSAVALAWGEPSNRVEGFRNTRRTERWEYNASRPVVLRQFYGGYRSGYYGHYRYSCMGAGFGPEIVHSSYRKSAVWFIDGKVDEWERLK